MLRRVRLKPKSTSRERNSWGYFATLKAQRIKWQRHEGVRRFTKVWKVSSLHVVSYMLKRKRQALFQLRSVSLICVYIQVVVVGLSAHSWLCWAIAAGLFSLVAAGRSCPLAGAHWLSLCWLLLSQRVDSRPRAQQFRLMGLVAPRHVGSSQIRDQTCVSCIGRWMLYH